MAIDVSIFIPTKNRPVLLDRLLNSINNQSFLDNNKYAVTPDSSGDNKTKDMVNNWKDISNNNLYIDYEFNAKDAQPIDNWVLLLNKLLLNIQNLCDTTG